MYGTIPPTSAGAGGVLAMTGVPFYQILGIAMMGIGAAVAGLLLMRSQWRRRADTAS